MIDTGVIAGVSVSHALASVEEIESVQVTDEETLVSSLIAREGVEEAVCLQTCNRAEAYVAADDDAAARSALSSFAPDVRDGAVVRLDHEESLRHLMRVAAGLESLVLGEDQILGQLSDAAALARETGGLSGGVLDDALSKALQVGKRARAETGINEGSVSLGSAAVELAERETDLADATALVVGAGQMGTLAARALDASPVSRIVVANRTRAAAEHIVADLDSDSTAVGLAAVSSLAAEADVLITATGADEPVVDEGTVGDAGETLCIDLGQPRDVVPEAGGDAVVVRDIDDLETVTGETRERREQAATAVEEMIDEEFDRLLAEFKRKRADDAVSAMYEAAERTKRRELNEALAKLEAQGELTDDQRETVAGLADALVGQLLAAPTKSLREAAAEDDWTTIHTAMELFDPEFDDAVATHGGEPAGGTDDAGGIPAHVLERLSDD
ncbi:glutamyl-tRNA reductase [Halobaculum sp. CBA1158]|uniref:glutamyl-tRNA reductase n=1 Tax=Halobaculum sp. CBA1158 TaxID=2904243 RepID=UPI001EFFE9BA|nr:glutamyl-tRNA reductase [Halobaculum sp. CBA1158]UIO99513.1 glutamyl-tRNA reductase [Halobaculum sp. CBA1158]